MARRKNLDPINGLDVVSQDKLLVIKSNPLTSLWRSDMTLGEFKILDVYLSRINSHDPDHARVTFTQKELENLLGVTQLQPAVLRNRLKRLMGNVVELKDPSYKKGFHLVTLFSEAIVEEDDRGVKTVYLECTDKAMKYFFNVENLGYLKYKVHAITEIKSRYTYILFIYLEQNRFRKTWEISVDDLKTLLSCNESTYEQFKYFNDFILKKCQKELAEKTECKFEYETIKKGRKVERIRFTIRPLSVPIPPVPSTIERPQALEIIETAEQDSNADDLEELLNNAGFTAEQISAIKLELDNVPSSLLPSDYLVDDDLFWRKYHYLQEKLLLMQNQPDIRRPFNYLLKIIKQDTESSSSSSLS